jgi:5,10-methylenetetrahydromethanopterin reductase
MMRIGVFFDGFTSTSEMLDVARRAETAGAHSLWFAQHMGYRDAIVWAAAAANATQTIALVPTAISPYLWPPLPIAMAMGTLGEIAPGRVALAVGVGNLLNLGESGAEPVAPVRVVREYVETLRALHDGEVVHGDGKVHKLRGAKMVFDAGPRYPLYVASTGPQMLRLAGEIGDGVLLSAGLTLASCRDCLAHVDAGVAAAGRDKATLRKASFINFRASRDGEAAKAAVLRKLAFLFRNRGHADNIKSSGLAIDHEKIIQCLAAHDLDAATRLMPMAAANVFAVAGTPAECSARLADYLSAGLDEAIIEVTGTAEERALALDVVRDVAGRA